jgi:serine/threonine-protein kinase
MGEVYRADDLKLGQPVALKFLTEKLSHDKAMLARFHGEVAMAHRVTHPNVCRVHDIGEVTTSSGKLHFLSMEYVDGEDLSSLLRRIGRLQPDKAVEIANQLCAGLAAAHEAGVLHRDLKPANVMIDGKGRVRITDFGLAGFAEQFTGSEVLAGTPAYMSPEQFAGKEVTTKSDIYALGLVLYELFTGKRVFEAGSLEELKRMHESSAPANPSSWVKDLDPLVERVILRCLEKDPAKRLASAKQVADALPGGDPLAAALAMGEMPSPEMVAAAGQKTAMKPGYAVACLVAIVIGVVLCSVLANQFWLLPKLMRDNSPDVLEQKARTIIQQVGYTERPRDWARGLDFNYDYRRYLEEKVSTDKQWEQHTNAPLSALNFWYRQSPQWLMPSHFGSQGSVTFDDPVQNASEAIGLRLDATGRLLEFQATPLQFDSTPAKTSAFDWRLLLDAAGLDAARLASADPQWMPLSGFDVRVAWTGTYENLHIQIPIRVEAAAYRGRPVYFQIIWPWTKPLRQEQQEGSGDVIVFYIINVALLIGAIWLARHHWHTRRGDRKGAFRLALFAFVAQLLRWILVGSHTPTLAALITFFFVTISQALLWAAVAWLFYMALEPLVRRRWPNVLISWNRLLNGQLRDSLVGRDILIGILFVVLMMIRFYLESWFELKFQTGTFQFSDQQLISDFTGVGKFFGAMVGNLWIVPLVSMGSLLLILLFRVLTRRQWLAVTLYVLLGIGFNILYVRQNPLMVALLVGIYFAVSAFILLRFGLLAFTAYSLFTWFGLPVSANFNTWYSIYALLGNGIVLAMAIYAFHTSLGGQKVFSGKLLEE